MLNFYLFFASPPPAVLTFFRFLSISRRGKTLENKRWVEPSSYSHKTLEVGQYKN
jgi:hypothetical protein